MEGGELVWIEQLGGLRMVAVQLAGLPPAFADGLTGALEHLLVVGVLPLDQIADDGEQLLALDLGLFLVDAVFEAAVLLIAGVVDQLREDHRPRRRQRSPCPPEMQGARVPVADRLLARYGGVDVVER